MIRQPFVPPGVQRVQLGRTWYVIVKESIFERLCAAAGATATGPDRLAAAHAGLTPFAMDDGSLARRLLERRQRVGLSQSELARRSGIRAETLNRIERGKTTPDFATIRKLIVAINAAS